MEKEYVTKIIEAAHSKLLSAGKPLSEMELIPGILKRLKTSVGKTDKRHTSKIRFKKEYFSTIAENDLWKNSIIQLPNKRYVLKTDKDKFTERDSSELWNWNYATYDEAIKLKVANLQTIDAYKLEKLVSIILNKIFPDYYFHETKKTGDGGIDVIGEIKNSRKSEGVFVQVKRFKGTVSREKANEFHGTIMHFKKSKKLKRVIGLYITTGKFSSTFSEFLKLNEEVGIKYNQWNGEELARQMLKHGIGVKYSIDFDFWSEVDSKAVLKIKPKTRKK